MIHPVHLYYRESIIFSMDRFHSVISRQTIPPRDVPPPFSGGMSYACKNGGETSGREIVRGKMSGGTMS